MTTGTNMGQCCGYYELDTKSLAVELITFETSLDKLRVILQKNEAIPEETLGKDTVTLQPGASGWKEQVRAVNVPIHGQESGIALTGKVLSSLERIIKLLPEEVRIELDELRQNKSNETVTDYRSSSLETCSQTPQNQDFRSTEKEESRLIEQNQNKRKRNIHEEENQQKSQEKATSDDQIKSSSKKSNKKKRIVQLYYRQESDILDEVAKELKTKLINKCPAVEVNECKSVKDLQNNTPAILLCINASRLGTDVSGAMQGLQYPEKTAVVVLHHKLEHALPSLPSEQLLTGAEYQSLGRITDMAFLSDRGIYSCDMNDQGFKQLIDFIKSN